MAGSAAETFAAQNTPAVSAQARAALGRILGRRIPEPEAVYFHDWRRDPCFRGAYSYVPVGALHARESLSQPEDGTLIFAGEAANVAGHGGTVHGAIASGTRAVQLLIKK